MLMLMMKTTMMMMLVCLLGDWVVGEEAAMVPGTAAGHDKGRRG